MADHRRRHAAATRTLRKPPNPATLFHGGWTPHDLSCPGRWAVPQVLEDARRWAALPSYSHAQQLAQSTPPGERRLPPYADCGWLEREGDSHAALDLDRFPATDDEVAQIPFSRDPEHTAHAFDTRWAPRSDPQSFLRLQCNHCVTSCKRSVAIDVPK